MTSAMARRDCERMQADGLHLSCDDIVRLNALAVKAQATADCAINVHVRRAAFLPRKHWWQRQVIVSEPTIAHWLWLERANDIFAFEDSRALYCVYGYVLSREAGDLPRITDVARVKKAIAKFARRHLLWLTDRQLFGAIDYCLVGSDWTAGESASEPNETDEKPNTPSPSLAILAVGRAYGLAISTDDLGAMMPSEVEEAILLAQIKAGLVDRSASRARAVAAYVRAREEIRNRAKEDLTDGK